MTPKRDPRSTSKRPKTDIKIDINFDAKTKRAGHGLIFVSWGRDPPQGGAPGALGRGPTRHGTGPQAPMRAVKDQKKYTIIQVYKVYSIHYTVYSVHGYSIQCVKGTVYSIQGARA